MAKRMILMLIVLFSILALIGFVKYRQIQAGIAQSNSFQPPPEAVTTTIATADLWGEKLGAIGTVQAVHGVTISADLPGIVASIDFDSGDRVDTGDLLVRLDTRQEQAQLAAADARRELARLNLERIRGLLEEGVTSRADFDAAVAEHDQAEALAGEIRATIDRKTTRAPFSGNLGIRSVDLGQYLTSGQPIVHLQSLDPIYVNFDVPQQDLVQVPVGAEVSISADGLSEAGLKGRITAIDSVVDVSTRNARVQATLANPGLALRPGMYVKVGVAQAAGTQVIPIPASAIRYAPYGDSVFIVEEMEAPGGGTYRGVRQQFVRLGSARGDLMAILSGIEPGDEVVTSGVFKLRNGAAVVINNEIQPGNDPSPRPEES
jgi:membrane fusion protein (multidrug efflux system)